ncbi:unnamed protein product [Moneuplotes crassus]|uniref:Kinesin-like protein n=2 Tax=Euplotes crassus TaxID=5936 RepID=A0AAD1Y5I1_EUPCR|nr:unnamed protein product [Moneuplotes crassus]
MKKNFRNKEKVKVAIRLRPYIDQDLPNNIGLEEQMVQDRHILYVQDDCTVVTNAKVKKAHRFDKVLDEEVTQQDLYEECEIDKYVDHVVEGYNATIFAFGQTGSGKTFTMEGYKYKMSETLNGFSQFESTPVAMTRQNENVGIIPRIVSELYEKIERVEFKKYRIYCSYLQIYQEKIYDLLNPLHSRKDYLQSNNNQQPEGLKLHFDVRNDRFNVDNLYKFECKNVKELMNYFHYGLKNKIMSSHALNEASSRSHCILSITVESIERENPDNIIVSTMQLVDLAGSERSSQTLNLDLGEYKSTKLKKEAIDINKSLFTLRQVVSMLNRSDGGKGKYIPYRESKLTSLLKHSLGGNSFCLMIACISPSSKFFNENISTLTYASKASCISNKPIKNHDPKNKVISGLKKEVQSLRSQLMMAHNLMGKSNNVCSKCGKSLSETEEESIDSLPNMTSELQENINSSAVTPASRLHNADGKNNPELALSRFNSEKQPKLPDFKKMFEKNETMMDKMTEDLMSLKEIMSAQNKLGLFERILLSAKMVKNVLKRNLELNKDYMDHTLQIDDLQKKLSQFQLENEDIRDRLSIMEALTGTDSYYIQMNYSSVKDEFTADMSKNKKDKLGMLNQDKMIALIYEFNKENSILKKRIERMEKKKIKNKFMQINDGMSSTAYSNHNIGHNKGKFKYGHTSDKILEDADDDQSYARGYKCSSSPKFAERHCDAEPVRCVIDAAEINHNLNRSGYHKNSSYQLEPLSGKKKTKNHLGRRDKLIKDTRGIDFRQFDTINSSLMNYEDMDSQINLEKSNIKRNMTAIRTKNPNSHSNQSIYNIAPEDIQSNLLSKFKKRKPQSIMGKLPPTKKSKTRIKNYRRQLNNYQ